MILLDENIFWKTADGRQIRFKNLTDTHLANIIDFIKRGIGKNEVSDYLETLAKKRGLSNSFLERAQIPYKNRKGKWEIWSFTSNNFLQIER